MICWKTEHQHTFNKLKKDLTSHAVLKGLDFEQPFILQMDASDVGVGAEWD